MQWDTRNFGQKLGAGLGTGMKDLSQLMELLQGKRKAAQQQRFSNALQRDRFDLQKQQLDLQKQQFEHRKLLDIITKGKGAPPPQTPNIRPELTEVGALLNGPGAMSGQGAMDAFNGLLNPTHEYSYVNTRTPITQPQNNVEQPYQPVSTAGKKWADYQNGVPYNILFPATKKQSKVAPNIVRDIHAAVAKENANVGNSLYDKLDPEQQAKVGYVPPEKVTPMGVFNRDYRHNMPSLQRNYPADFGPNATDSVSTILQGRKYVNDGFQYSPAAQVGMTREQVGVNGEQTANPNDLVEFEDADDFIQWYNQTGRQHPNRDSILEQAASALGITVDSLKNAAAMRLYNANTTQVR